MAAFKIVFDLFYSAVFREGDVCKPYATLSPTASTRSHTSVSVTWEVTLLVNRGQMWRHPENSTEVSGMAQVSPYEDLIVCSLAFKIDAIFCSWTKSNFLYNNQNAVYKALLCRVICKNLKRRREWNIILHLIYIKFVLNHMLWDYKNFIFS